MVTAEWDLSRRSVQFIGQERPRSYIAFPGDPEDPVPIQLTPQERLEGTVNRLNIRLDVRKTPGEALLWLNQASSIREIGKKPILAAVNTEENTGIQELELFNMLFGRDSLIASRDLLPGYPQIARRTIISLAELQGVQKTPADDLYDKREEEEGKILHEYRDDRINQSWPYPYYGSADATPLHLQLIGAMARRYGPNILYERYKDRYGEERTILHSAAMDATWIERQMEKNPHGMVEPKRRNPKGIRYQAWRDSYDGFHHVDGRLADDTYGVSSFSVQIDAYKAFQAAAFLFLKQKSRYLELTDVLKKNILKHWVEDDRGGYFALGSELQANGSRELLEVRTSDMGHILNTDILEGEDPEKKRMRDMLVETLFSEGMRAAGGIRSLDKNEIRFTPRGYQTGRVWPKENGEIAKGLERHRYSRHAHDLHESNANIWYQTGYFPESVSGDDSPNITLGIRVADSRYQDEEPHRVEQPPQLIQAWSLTSIERSLEYLEYERTTGHPPLVG